MAFKIFTVFSLGLDNSNVLWKKVECKKGSFKMFNPWKLVKNYSIFKFKHKNCTLKFIF